MLAVNSSSSATLQNLFSLSPIVTGSKSTASPISAAASSPASKKSTGTDTDSSSSAASSVPQAVITALENYVSPTQKAWTALTQSLKSGDIASAQTALAAYSTALSAAEGTLSAPSSAFLDDLTGLGD